MDLLKTKKFAQDAHKDQKYGGHPYIKHLQDVYAVLIEQGIKDKEILCAAWLHDTIEDTSTSYEDILNTFSKEIADIVFAVTNEEGKNRKERNFKTYPKIKNNKKATILKLADRIANVKESISNNPNLLEMYKKEYSSFREGIFNETFAQEITINRMWSYLDTLLNTKT